MNSNYYKIYLDKVMQLAHTLVIKSQASVEGLNQFTKDYYGRDTVDPVDPTTWKYYMNICGEYHFTDKTMHVISMDTVEEIVFSKENLQIHRATAREYSFGSRKYKELVARYPNQEILVRGILYPSNKQQAIAAKDGTILTYAKNLVESNEYSLIPNLQKWIDGYQVRWVNSQYAISDELYSAVSHGIMYLNLVPAILTLRRAACKTSEAHSFHVNQYLGSHGIQDVQLQQLTKKQSLFLYRNIAYIRRNSGQQNIFEWLTENLLTERGVPLAEFTIRHDLSGQPEDLYPDIKFRKKQLNLGYDISPVQTFTVDELLDKSIKAARDNDKYYQDHRTEIREMSENSLSNVVLTKALDSSMIDYSNSTPYTMEATLLSHWVRLAELGYYKPYVAITNPQTGERVPLSVKDAYVFMWYALSRSVNIEPVEIPAFPAVRVSIVPAPSVDTLMSVVDSKYVSRAFAQEMKDLMPEIVPVFSTEAFYNQCVEINTAENLQRLYIAKEEHHTSRAMKENLVCRLYSDNMCVLEPAGTLYAGWLSDRNLNLENFKRDDYAKLCVEITKEATGLSLVTTNSVKALQAAMIRLMVQLSSYSVQYLTYINNVDIKLTDWTAVRVGDMVGTATGIGSIDILIDGIVKTKTKTKQLAKYQTNGIGVIALHLPSFNLGVKYDINVKPMKTSREVSHHRFFSAPVGATLAVQPVSTEPGIIAVPGIEAYIAMTPAQRRAVGDVWSV